MDKIFLDTNTFYYYCGIQKRDDIKQLDLIKFLDSNIGKLWINDACFFEMIVKHRKDIETVNHLLKFLQRKKIEFEELRNATFDKCKDLLKHEIGQINKLPDMLQVAMVVKADIESEILVGFLVSCSLCFLMCVLEDGINNNIIIKIVEEIFKSKLNGYQEICKSNLIKAYEENCTDKIVKMTFSMLLAGTINESLVSYLTNSPNITSERYNLLCQIKKRIQNPKKEITETIAKILFNEDFKENKKSYIKHLKNFSPEKGNIAQKTHWFKIVERIIDNKDITKFNKNDIMDWALLQSFGNNNVILSFDSKIINTLNQCDKLSYDFIIKFCK